MAEAARNIACTGAEPLGITDCLNFGNPERPEVYHQFTEACRGIADACVAFGTPVTGGNVSFYNESPLGAIDPTPTVGMVGLLRRAADRVPSHFSTEGDAIVFLAVGSTGTLVRRDTGTFCGVVLGKYRDSVRLLGMFDLPENRAPAVEREVP